MHTVIKRSAILEGRILGRGGVWGRTVCQFDGLMFEERCFMWSLAVPSGVITLCKTSFQPSGLDVSGGGGLVVEGFFPPNLRIVKTSKPKVSGSVGGAPLITTLLTSAPGHGAGRSHFHLLLTD